MELTEVLPPTVTFVADWAIDFEALLSNKTATAVTPKIQFFVLLANIEDLFIIDQLISFFVST